MFSRSIPVMLFVLFGHLNDAAAQPTHDPSRGELLYATHCIACHAENVHWRDKRLVKNFKSLQAEVGRWQKLSALGWNDEDISAVAQYLNALHYHYPAP